MLAFAFPLYFEEMVFNGIFFSVNYVLRPSEFFDYLRILSFNADALKSFLEMTVFISFTGLMIFRKEMSFQLWKWVPWIAVVAIWVIQFHLIVSQPLPDGTGYFDHSSFIANGFEILEVSTFCLGYCLTFIHNIKKKAIAIIKVAGR